MRLHPSVSLASLFILVGACSLINAPDDVVPEGAGATASAGTPAQGGTDATNGGNGSEGGTGDMSSGGDLTGIGGDITGAGGDTTTDVDPGPGVNPTTGTPGSRPTSGAISTGSSTVPPRRPWIRARSGT
jgi:hypothetical protein